MLQGVSRNMTVLNSFKCLLPYIILDIKDFLHVIFFSNIFYFEIKILQ